MQAALDKMRVVDHVESIFELFKANFEHAVRLQKNIVNGWTSSLPVPFLGRIINYGLKKYDAHLLAAMEKGKNPLYSEYKKMREYAEERGLYGSVALNFSDAFCSTIIVMDENGNPVMGNTIDWPYSKIGKETMVVNLETDAGHQTAALLPGQLCSIRVNSKEFSAAIHVAPHNRARNMKFLSRKIKWLYRLAWPVRHTELFNKILSSYIMLGNTLTKQLSRGKITPSQALLLTSEKSMGYEESLAFFVKQPFAHDAIIPFIGKNAGEACIVEIRAGRTPMIRHFSSTPKNIPCAHNIHGNDQALFAFNAFEGLSKKYKTHYIGRMDSDGRKERCEASPDIANTVSGFFKKTITEDGTLDETACAAEITTFLGSIINHELRLVFFASSALGKAVFCGYDLPERKKTWLRSSIF